MASRSQLETLLTLLKKREAVIADHSFRDRDEAAHLQALIDTSGEIESWYAGADKSSLDADLQHFLVKRSYEKARKWIEAQ